MPLALLALTTFWIGLGFCALVRAIGRGAPKRPLSPDRSAVTLLKPLAGADPSLEENLESFFVLDHPSYEIVFGVADPADPSIAIVRALERKHPEVSSRLVIEPVQAGINPKVANLRAMIAFASHDLVLISDSSVRVPPSYLAEAVRALEADGARPVGLVTHVFAGVGEKTAGAMLENVQLNGFVASGAALPTLLGDAAVIGKSMLFRRSVFDRLGGFESVADVLAEDFLIGKMFQHAGYDVRIAPTVIESVNGSVTMKRCIERQLRWSMLRFRLHPLAFLLEPLTSPVAMLPFALAALGPWALVWAAVLIAVRDGGQWALLRGRRRVLLAIVLGPARDLVMLGTWLATPFVKHVSWRGHRVRLGTGTRAFIAEVPLMP
jgi:ceramide glucosyltransferase